MKVIIKGTMTSSRPTSVMQQRRVSLPRLLKIWKLLRKNGDCSSIGRVPGCDSGGSGIETHQSPKLKF